MKIPLIKPDLPSIEDVCASFEEILANGRITNFGKYMNQFEAETGTYLGTPTAALSSGTAGLVFTLAALGLKAGQKVILPSFTFMATAQAVLYAGGIPVFAEIGDDLTLCTDDLERLLEEHPDTGAVIAVHMYGLPAQVGKLEAVVARASERCGRKIALIFDAAHAFGSSVDGEMVGGFGDAEVFSLSVTKVLVTVEGGLVSTRDPELLKKIRCMRNYGVLSNYNAHFPGLNGKMSEFHAIVGLHNLRRLGLLLSTRQEKAKCFRRKIESQTQFQVTSWPEGVVHTFKDFTVLVPEIAKDGYRDQVMRFLADREVETRAYFYPPVHRQAYFVGYANRSLPKTDRLAGRVITLPFFTSITQEEMEYIVSALQDAERELL
ncbi:MAG TPA: DegT/DnrJ/EryC1/StrS family aminotransferase [Acidobacteriota bacterium]|nr:DegT/DnrJ/EryC1/StrS family aminotransferase [Acidobacteriota bacterium]